MDHLIYCIIKLFIINNNGYGIIKQFQELYLHKRYEATINNKFISPLQRINNYLDSKKMKGQLDITLEAAKKFYSKKENNKIGPTQ